MAHNLFLPAKHISFSQKFDMATANQPYRRLPTHRRVFISDAYQAEVTPNSRIISHQHFGFLKQRHSGPAPATETINRHLTIHRLISLLLISLGKSFTHSHTCTARRPSGKAGKDTIRRQTPIYRHERNHSTCKIMVIHAF